MRRILKWIGLLGIGLSILFILFVALFVYPRPSRLPDPLSAIKGIESADATQWGVVFRLADRRPDAASSSPRWNEGLSVLSRYSYAATLPRPGEIRLQAGIGLLKRGEMESMEGLFAPTPTDWTYTVQVPAQGRLSLAMAVLPPKKGRSAPARFIVQAAEPGINGGSETIMDRVVVTSAHKDKIRPWDDIREYLHPDIRGKYGHWERADLDLSRWEGRTVRLTLSTRSVEPSQELLPVVWGDPVLLGRLDQAVPNVIVILVDAMRPDAMGVYGSKRNATPNMDRLAREGVIFKQARSSSIDTRTSETSFFTGRYPGEIGIHYRNRAVGPIELDHFRAISPESLPRSLGDYGYATRAVVNNMFLLEFSQTGYDLGFDEVYNNNRATLDTVDLTDRAIGWLARNRQRPFFMFLNYNSPHGLYRPPVKNLQQVATLSQIVGYDLPSWYRGSVAYVDEYVGILTTALKRLGLLDRTLIVITADHGQVFDPAHDYGIPDRNVRTYNRHGYTLYDEEIRVPLILRLPGRIPAGRVVEDPVSLVDVYPTIAELAGIPAPKNLSGRSLVPLIRGRSLPPRPIYAEGRQIKALVRDGIKYIYREKPVARLLRRTPEGEKPIRVSEELYDLNRDPDEHRNLIGSDDERSATLAGEMRVLFRSWAPPDLMLNHVRLAAGHGPHSFTGRASVPERSGARIRFFEVVDQQGDPQEVPAKLQTDGDTALAFSANLAEGQWAGFLFETDPPDAPIRVDLVMDGHPVKPDRLYGGPMGLPGLILPAQTLSMPDLGFLGSGGGVLKNPPYDPRYETGAFIWRTAYVDYVASTVSNRGLRSEVKDVLLDWGYIQKDEKR